MLLFVFKMVKSLLMFCTEAIVKNDIKYEKNSIPEPCDEIINIYKENLNNWRKVLLFSYEKKYLVIFNHLIEHRFEPKILAWACEYGYLDIVKYIVKFDGVKCCTSLILASYYNHLDIVKYLVEHGADIHFDYEYALRYASLQGNLNIVKYLVKNGADIRAGRAQTNEALFFALYKNQQHVVDYLINL